MSAAGYGITVAPRVLVSWRRRLGASIAIVAVLVTAALATAGAAGPGGPPSRLEVHFIDVGQGDAVLVRAPSGKTMLVDGGPVEASDRLATYLKGRGVSGIDVVVATHPHADHIGGLLEVLETFPVGLVIDSGKVHTTVTYERFLRLVDQKDIRFRLGRARDPIDLGPGLDISILHPSEPLADELNECSVVLRLRFGRAVFLMMGDAEREAEEAILRSRTDVRADVLKVAHHGSSTSSSPRFLMAVGPAVSVVCVGAGNAFGHPHQSTLDNLAACGAGVYRTDVHGDVVVSTDGKTIEVECARSRPWR